MGKSPSVVSLRLLGRFITLSCYFWFVETSRSSGNIWNKYTCYRVALCFASIRRKWNRSQKRIVRALRSSNREKWSIIKDIKQTDLNSSEMGSDPCAFLLFCAIDRPLKTYLTIVSLTQITGCHCFHLIKERSLTFCVRQVLICLYDGISFRPSQKQIAKKEIMI